MKTLWREKQCAKCPWRVATNPRDIPRGYSEERHRALAGTIAEPGVPSGGGKAMACHESTHDDEEPYCVGWLVHQLGPGNNIPLRIRMRAYDLSRVRVVGEQHERFEDTLP